MKLSSQPGFGRTCLLSLLISSLAIFGLQPAATAQQAGNSPAATGPAVIPGVVAFKLKPAVKRHAHLHQIEDADLQAALARVGARDLTQSFPRAVAAPADRAAQGVDLTLVYQIGYSAPLSFETVKQQLLASGAVAYVEPLYNRALLAQPNDPLADSTRTGYQYHLKNIRAYRAWDVEQGDTTMVVGVTDTGTLFSHQDLQGQFALNYADPINGVDDDNDGYVDNFRGWDMADSDNNPSVDDTNIGNLQPKHGVLVSGVLAARTNNGKGVAGAGYRCRILPIKVFATTSPRLFAGFEGIVYAADHGCKVINCSWGSPGGYSQYEQDVITYATVNRDAVVVAAAGNFNANMDFYPASYQGVLSVASLDRHDIKGATNTYSHRVSLAAPGKQILTTHFINDSAYVAVSGSSFAAPQVAGAVALVRHHFPSLTAAQAAERVRMTADTSIYALPGNAPYQEMLGHGRVNLYRALTDTAARSLRIASLRCNRSRVGGDTVLVRADFLNCLAALRGVAVTLTTASPNVQVASGAFSAGQVGPLATTTPQAFRIVLLPDTTPHRTVELRFDFHDASGYSDYQYVKVLVDTIQGPGVVMGTATSEARAASFDLWPNPTTGDAQLMVAGAARVTVLDALGRPVLATTTTDLATLPLGQQPAGLYVVRVVMADGTVLTRRLVRQ